MTTPLRARAEHAAKYNAHLVVPAVDVKNALEQLEQAEAQVRAVRELHQDDGRGDCTACDGINGMGECWPCPTIRALDGAS